MNREPVKSAAVTSVGYDRETRTLEVEFPRGAVVTHEGVPPEVFERLKSATSIGGFYNAYVRPQYPFRYVEADA